METRQETLMNNMAYKVALYMDPRWNFDGSSLFSITEKEEIAVVILQATLHILHIAVN